MKKIGIVGGVGWASTLDYYRGICQAAASISTERGAHSPRPVPAITIESVIQSETRALRGTPGDEASWAAFDAVFRKALLTLEQAGCDFAMIASNTPHARLEAIRKGVSIPILSIFDAVAQATAATPARKALVLGTAVTMQAGNYATALAEHNITANARLDDTEIDAMQQLIDTDFYGGATQNGKEQLLAACKRHADADTAVILACTELPLAFPEHKDDVAFHADGFLFINTSAAHVARAVDMAMA